MTLSRRGFLAGVLAAGAAPAIVRAGSLMKIFVPSQAIILPDEWRSIYAADVINNARDAALKLYRECTYGVANGLVIHETMTLTRGLGEPEWERQYSIRL